jgi:antirestriction protein
VAKEVATMSDTTPRIYVACLAAYNNGKLHGRWIDADEGVEHIWSEVNAMLKASPEPGAEEWAIHDYEGFGGWRMSEWESFDKVAEVAEAITEHGEGPIGAFLSVTGDDDLSGFEDKYRGEWDSEKDYAEHIVEECGWGGVCPVPEGLMSYLDMDSIARDLFIDGFTSVESGAPNYGVYVFDDYA